MPSGVLPQGLVDPVHESQRIFRTVLKAFSEPGAVLDVGLQNPPPRPMHVAAAAFALTMFDSSTPVWLDDHFAIPAVRDFLTFHTECPIVSDPQAAQFAIADAWGIETFSGFAQGSAEFPDRSATVVLHATSLDDERGVRLSGPGIEHARYLNADGAAAGFWHALAENNAQFPLGVDVVLVASHRIACLPRSVRVEA